jgi:hypothetical protein
MKDTTIKNELTKIAIDQQDDIPWIIRLLENPKSFLPFPGKISLYDHDCLHVLLDRGISLKDEAFVVGFTMGNDPSTKWFHVILYKLVSRLFYPPKFRFSLPDFKSFDLGFAYGRKIGKKHPNMNKIPFGFYANESLEQLREMFDIDAEELEFLNKLEEWMLSAC